MRRDESLLGQKMSLAKICSIDKFKSAENIFVLLVKTQNYGFFGETISLFVRHKKGWIFGIP